MKKLKSPVIVAAFILGVGGAFAFNAPKQQDPRPVFGLSQSGQWINVTNQQEGIDYQCNQSSATCTANLVNDDPNQGQVETVIEQGDFSETP